VKGDIVTRRFCLYVKEGRFLTMMGLGNAGDDSDAQALDISDQVPPDEAKWSPRTPGPRSGGALGGGSRTNTEWG